ncbi:12947_t:CDS:2 [Cetraspora pellucida]|uniref:12947_t:CDS:1 n=1 Tax=Cetraspora pellucida TaxID=1433469 RepID=A0A9N9B5V9_9GLOM|nr:12947_t:CDS:2 [Cetraspora pellucida]
MASKKKSTQEINIRKNSQSSNEYDKTKVIYKNINSETNFEININNYYNNEENYIIWSCIGWINVKKNVENKFEISKSIDIKIVIFNYNNVKELENTNFEKALESFEDNNDLYFDNL